MSTNITLTLIRVEQQQDSFLKAHGGAVLIYFFVLIAIFGMACKACYYKFCCGEDTDEESSQDITPDDSNNNSGAVQKPSAVELSETVLEMNGMSVEEKVTMEDFMRTTSALHATDEREELSTSGEEAIEIFHSVELRADLRSELARQRSCSSPWPGRIRHATTRSASPRGRKPERGHITANPLGDVEMRSRSAMERSRDQNMITSVSSINLDQSTIYGSFEKSSPNDDMDEVGDDHRREMFYQVLLGGSRCEYSTLEF